MKKSFTAHQNLIRQVIERQAGTLTKALAEGVMNSIDAGAKSIVVEFLAEGQGKIGKVRIVDDGQGFRSRREVDLCFGTFGQPHEMEGDNSTDARYGTFRIGRGQMFAFGRNIWKTGLYQIEVDIRDGLEYQVTKLPERRKGTEVTIQLFDPLDRNELNWQAKQLQELILFSPVDVTIKFEEEDYEVVVGDNNPDFWTHQEGGFSFAADVDAYSLHVYCDGMFVERLAVHDCGLRGYLNSPKGLKLNTARNSVIRDCPLWKMMMEKIRFLSFGMFEARTTFSPAEVQAFWKTVTQWGLAGSKLRDFLDRRKLILLADESVVDYRTIRKWFGSRGRFKDAGRRLAFLTDDSQLADYNLQNNQALPLSRSLVNWFGSFEVDRELLRELNVELVSEDEIREISDNKPADILDKDQWTVWEGRFVKLVEGLVPKSMTRRTIHIGLHPGRLAWTDGRSYIACERRWVDRMRNMGMGQIVETVTTVLHEYAHDGPSDGVAHDLVFYRDFHDLMSEDGPWMIAKIHQRTAAAKAKNKNYEETY